jgi:DNA-binding MarR family transcriptional regulator
MVTPGKPDDATALAASLGPALLRLVRQFRAGIPGLGLSPAQAMLLKRVQEWPGIGVSDLATAERIRRPTISSLLKQLEAAGLVRRLPPPADDRRRVGFTITPAGEALFDAVKDQWTAWLARRLEDVPEPGRRALADALPYLVAMSVETDTRR